MIPALRRLCTGRGVLALAVLLPVVLYLSVYLRYRISASPMLDQQGQDRAVQLLRASLNGAQADGVMPGAGITCRGPVWVSVYLEGARILRHRDACETTLDRALDQLARHLAANRRTEYSRERLQLARIKIDITLAQGPIISSIPLAFAKSVVPGLDGLGLEVGPHQTYLLPDDMFQQQLLAGYRPFWFMHEFKTGLDLKQTVNLLAAQTDLTIEQWRASPRRYFRFRTQSVLEADGRGLTVLRSRVPVPSVKREDVRQAVKRAVDYVLRQMKPDGKFEYIYYPLADRHSPPGDYSLPRHAGTTWFLALSYSILKERRILEAARKAIVWLGANAVPVQCQKTPFACVGSGGWVDLGSAALTVVAIVEYQQATGDKRFEKLALRLGKFMLYMQKPSGDFCHQYMTIQKHRVCKTILLYYSGEATLALAKLYQLTKDPQYKEPIERAMDFLTGAKYDFFLGQFFISEDHWTCIAAEAARPVVDKEQYARFCYEFAALNRRAQVNPQDGLAADLTGAFNITPFFLPHNTPAGSRTEANVATYLLSQQRGEPQAEVLETVQRSIRYLVDQQIRPESAYLFPNADAAMGGMMQTPGRAAIRIDYVQHAAAAMARALPLIPE